MNAVLAIIANGKRAIIVINREAVQVKLFFSCLFQPLVKRLPGVMYVRPSKPLAPSWWGCLCACV